MTDDKLTELGRELPWDRPDAARREAVRAALLLAADDAPPRPARRGFAVAGGAFAAGAVAAAAIAVLVVQRQPVAMPLPRAQITASSAAELEHTVAGDDEIVRVHAGTVRVAAPGAAGAGVGETAHLRVQTRDAAVDGAGEYEVVVAHDQLASVTVRAGSARIQVSGHSQPVFLAAGEAWHAAVVTADIALDKPSVAPMLIAPAPASPASATIAPAAVAPAAPAPAVQPSISTSRHASQLSAPAQPSARAPTPAPTIATLAPSATTPNTPLVAPTPPSNVAPSAPALAVAPPTSEPSPAPALTAAPTRASSPTERHFQAGWTLLRANQPREAAIELGLAADAGAAAHDPLAGDARYFQAVALVKAGATTDAEHTLASFLAQTPASLRRGHAAILLGRLLAQRGDATTARTWFAAAQHDPDPDVAAAARAGLATLPP